MAKIGKGAGRRVWRRLSGRSARERQSAQAQRPLGFAVVGLGHIAQAEVLPAFANAREHARLVALVSGDKQKRKALARQYGVRKAFSYDDLGECLADEEVEAIYVALPNTMHEEVVLRAARAGVHVLCEKPMATSAAACQRMISECDEADVKLMIAYRLHFEEANLRAIEEIQRGAIGEPRVFSSTFSFQVREGNIRTKADLGGGALWDIGIYCINAARSLFRAEPIEVFAARQQLGTDRRFAEVEEGAAAVLRFPDDRLASFAVSFGTTATARYEVLGTKGRLEVDNAYEYQGDIVLRIHPDGGSPREVRAATRDQFAPELVYFSRCVLEGERPEPDGYEGLADVRVIEALYESAHSSRPIMLEPVEKRQRPSIQQSFYKERREGEPPLVDVHAPSQD